MANGIQDTDSAGSSTLLPEVWAKQTRDSFLPNLVMANLVDRSFEQELAGRAGHKIWVDGAGGTTAGTSSGFDVTNNPLLAAGGTMTAEVMTLLTQTSITVDTHAYKFWDLEYELDLLTQFPLMERMAERAGFVVAQYVDSIGAGLIDNFSQSVGTAGIDFTDEVIRRGVQYLDDANVPPANRHALISVAQASALLGVEQYRNSLYQGTTDISGSGNKGTARGPIGNLYGMDWNVSTAVEGANGTGHDNGFWYEEALALVMLDNMRTAQDYEITTDSHRYAVHAIFGWAEMRDTSGVWAKGA